MSNSRLLTAIIVCAGVLAAGAGATGSATAVAQQTGAAPPPASKPKAATSKPAPAARTAKPIEVDPMFDPTLIEIREKVTFDDERWAAFLERYGVLRADQRDLILAIRTEAAKRRAEERAESKEAAERGAGRNDRPPSKEGAAGRGLAADIDEKLKPLNERFVADARGIVGESQRAAWDACAESLDLTTQPRYFGLRPELRWRDPALGPKVGEMAPEFTLGNVDGEKVTLSSFLGTPVALLFGSTSSPDFRRTVEQAEMLQRAYREKVRWVIVYTFEAHPSDGWAVKLNEKLGIEIPKHKTYEERLAPARKVRNEQTPSCLVLVDDLDDTVTKQYYGHPNRYYLIDGEGRVLLKQVRFDERESTVTLYELLTGAQRADAFRTLIVTKPPVPRSAARPGPSA